MKGDRMRDRELKIRVDDAELEKVKADAAGAGLSTTDWIRKRLGLRYEKGEGA